MTKSTLDILERHERILTILYASPDPWTAKELSRRLGLSKRMIERYLVVLREDKLVECDQTKEPYRWYRPKASDAFAASAGATARGVSRGPRGYGLREVLRPIDFTAELESHRAGFKGRRWLVEVVRAWMANPSAGRVLLILGEPGLGKTAFAARLEVEEPTVAGVHFCQYHNAETKEPRRVICSLAYWLAAKLPEYRELLERTVLLEEIPGMEAGTLFDALLVTPLAKVTPPERPVMVVVEALDEAHARGNNPLASLLTIQTRRLPDWFRFLVTARPEPELVRVLDGAEIYRIDAADARCRADLIAYLNAELTSDLGGADGDTRLAQLEAVCEGNFLYATELVRALRAGELALSELSRHPRGLGGLFSAFFDRQFADEDRYRRRVRPLLEMVLAAPEPLPVKLAARALGWSEYQLGEILREVGSLFPTADGAIRPFHKSIVDWLTAPERSARYRVVATKGHRRLADALWRTCGSDPERLCEYGIRHIVQHLIGCGRWSAVERLLADFGFAMAQCARGLHAELLRDHAEAVARLPSPSRELRVWHAFLRANAHVLRRGDHRWGAERILLQLAVEHADDSPVTRAAEAWLALGKCDWDWLRKSTRPKTLPSAPLARLEGPVSSTYVQTHDLDAARVLSDHGHELRVWEANDGHLLLTIPWSGRIVAVLAGGSVLRIGLVTSPCAETETPEERRARPPVWGLEVWDTREGELQSALPLPAGWTLMEEFGARVVARDERSLVLGDDEGGLVARDVVTGSPLWTANAHGSAIGGVTRLRDGRILTWAGPRKHGDQTSAPASADGTIRIWDPECGALVRELRGHSDGVHEVVELSDGRLLSVAADLTLRVWSLASGAADVVLRTKEDCPGVLGRPGFFELFGEDAAAAYLDVEDPCGDTPQLSLFDLASGKIVRTGLCVGAADQFDRLIRLVDGRLMSWVGGHAYLWDGATGALLGSLSNVWPTVLRDGQVLLQPHAPDQLKADLEPVVLFGVCAVPGTRPGSGNVPETWRRPRARLLPNGKLLVGTALWALAHVRRIPLRLEEDAGLAAQRMAPLYAWLEAPHPELPTFPFGFLIGENAVDLGNGHFVAWERDPQAASARAGMLYVCTTAQNSEGSNVLPELGEWKAHSGPIAGAIALPTGRLCSWGEDRVLTLSDPRRQRVLWSMNGHAGEIFGVATLRTGLLVSWAQDGLRSWEPSGEPRATLSLEWSAGSRDRAAVLADGRLLVWASDGQMIVWDGVAGSAWATMRVDRPRLECVKVIHRRYLLAREREGRADLVQLTLWDGFTGKRIAPTGDGSALIGVKVVSGEQVLAWFEDGALAEIDAAAGALRHIAILRGVRISDVFAAEPRTLLVLDDRIGWRSIDAVTGRVEREVAWSEVAYDALAWVATALQQRTAVDWLRPLPPFASEVGGLEPREERVAGPWMVWLSAGRLTMKDEWENGRLQDGVATPPRALVLTQHKGPRQWQGVWHSDREFSFARLDPEGQISLRTEGGDFKLIRESKRTLQPSLGR